MLDVAFVPGGDFTRDKKSPLVSGGVINRDKRLAQPFVPVGVTNRDKRPPFCPGWWIQPGQKAPVPPLARLAVGPGTKATYCPGPKGCRDKWPGTKACFVVVNLSQRQFVNLVTQNA